MELEPSKALKIMKELLAKGRLSLFAGSGISVDSGLPTWDGFIDDYINACEKLNDTLKDSKDQEYLRFDDIIEDAKAQKDKDLLSTISALKEKVKECEEHGVKTDYICQEKIVKNTTGLNQTIIINILSLQIISTLSQPITTFS